MAKKTKKKVTTVRSHPLRVAISKNNPDGMTIRDQHKGAYEKLKSKN